MDIRIENIFFEETINDKSFQEKENVLSLIFGRTKYTQKDMRETWHRGIKHGIEIGLNRSSLDGQIIELNNNTIDINHREFLEKFYKLADEYKCGIQYHQKCGLVIIDINLNTSYEK